jgi:hypothetical protein
MKKTPDDGPYAMLSDNTPAMHPVLSRMWRSPVQPPSSAARQSSAERTTSAWHGSGAHPPNSPSSPDRAWASRRLSSRLR